MIAPATPQPSRASRPDHRDRPRRPPRPVQTTAGPGTIHRRDLFAGAAAFADRRARPSPSGTATGPEHPPDRPRRHERLVVLVRTRGSPTSDGASPRPESRGSGSTVPSIPPRLRAGAQVPRITTGRPHGPGPGPHRGRQRRSPRAGRAAAACSSSPVVPLTGRVDLHRPARGGYRQYVAGKVDHCYTRRGTFLPHVRDLTRTRNLRGWHQVRSALYRSIRSRGGRSGQHPVAWFRTGPDIDRVIVSSALRLPAGDEPWHLAVGLVGQHFPVVGRQRWIDQHPALPVPDESWDLDDLPSSALPPPGTWEEDPTSRAEFVQAYLASISATDGQIGRLLRGLDLSKTVVVVWSDHGYSLGHKRHFGKARLDAAVLRVPLLVAGPVSNRRTSTIRCRCSGCGRRSPSWPARPPIPPTRSPSTPRPATWCRGGEGRCRRSRRIWYSASTTPAAGPSSTTCGRIPVPG